MTQVSCFDVSCFDLIGDETTYSICLFVQVTEYHPHHVCGLFYYKLKTSHSTKYCGVVTYQHNMLIIRTVFIFSLLLCCFCLHFRGRLCLKIGEDYINILKTGDKI